MSERQQMGDILDRGDEEIGILFLLQRLAEGAEAAGGAVYVLNGNHEARSPLYILPSVHIFPS